VLGEAVAGVILHGSLTLDDYVPGRSDVDLLVVVDDPSATPSSPPWSR
jgi:predicted nucleotidyltransferase